MVFAAGSPSGLVLLLLDQGTALDDLPVVSGLGVVLLAGAAAAAAAVGSTSVPLFALRRCLRHMELLYRVFPGAALLVAPL